MAKGVGIRRGSEWRVGPSVAVCLGTDDVLRSAKQLTDSATNYKL